MRVIYTFICMIMEKLSDTFCQKNDACMITSLETGWIFFPLNLEIVLNIHSYNFAKKNFWTIILTWNCIWNAMNRRKWDFSLRAMRYWPSLEFMNSLYKIIIKTSWILTWNPSASFLHQRMLERMWEKSYSLVLFSKIPSHSQNAFPSPSCEF